jgi:hypothetical protein
LEHWLDGGRTEVRTLSTQLGSLPKSALRPVIGTYLTQRRAFTRNVLVFSGQTVMGASGRLELFTDTVTKSCVRTD